MSGFQIKPGVFKQLYMGVFLSSPSLSWALPSLQSISPMLSSSLCFPFSILCLKIWDFNYLLPHITVTLSANRNKWLKGRERKKKNNGDFPASWDHSLSDLKGRFSFLRILSSWVPTAVLSQKCLGKSPTEEKRVKSNRDFSLCF